MQISTLPATVPVLSRLSPVKVWQQLLTYLLEHHYGLTLNDTPFHDDASIQEHIEAGITLADAVIPWWNVMSWCAMTLKDSLGRSRRHF